MAIGGCTVEELKKRMTMAEALRWRRYRQQQPYGVERGDMQAGIVASVLVNQNLKKGAKSLSPSDFILNFEPRKKKTDDELEVMLIQVFQSLGAEVKRN